MKKNSILFARERKGRIFTPVITTTANKMTTLTITVNGNKAGEQVFFKAQFESANFFTVVDMVSEFSTVEDVKAAEATGVFQLV